MKQTKRLAAILMAIVMVLSLFPVVSFAGEGSLDEPIANERNYGLINQYHVGTQAVTDAYMRGETLELNGVSVGQPIRDLPSSWDSRNYNWITSVKDQGSYGSCWAHAALGSVEAYMIKEGIPVGTGAAATTSLNLSETQHCFFNYSSAYDAEGMLTGDKSTATASDAKNGLNCGGNGEMSAYTLQRWTGAASESVSALAYSRASTVASSGLNSQYAYGSNICHVQNSYWIPATNIAAVKQHIMDYGAGNISYYAGGSFGDSQYSNTYQCYIDTTSQDNSSHRWANHAITLVGWDDTIAVSRFSPHKPSNPGAWLCRNSWGTSYFNQGYMWISYEDTSVLEGYIYFYDAEPIDNYQHNYQYDGTCNPVCYGKGWSTSINYYEGFANDTKVANVFTANGSELLRAVALCNWDEAMSYTVEIYKNPTAGNPSSGTLMTSQTGTLTYSGYFTIPLNNPVSLAAGDTFSVVFTQNVPVADDNGKYIHTPYDATFNNTDVVSWCNWTHTNHGNTSYYKEPNGSWTDCPENGDYRIKAFTDDVTFTLSAVSNNTSWGTVSVAGSVITASPADGYYVESCDVISGSASCTINGNTISVSATEDCTVRVNFAPKPLYTVNFVASGSAEGSQSAYVNDAITLPASVGVTAAGWTFSGWMDHQIEETSEAPSYYAPGASYTVTGNATLYAVYTRVEAGTGGLYYELVTGAQDDWSGRYVITYSATPASMYVMKGAVPSGSNIESSANCATYANSGVSVQDTQMRNVADDYLFTVAPSGSYYTVRSVSTGYYLGVTQSTSNYLTSYSSYTANYSDWSLGVGSNGSGMQIAYASARYPYLGWSSSSNYFWTASAVNASIRLWKETVDSTTWYWTDPIVAEHEHELVYTEALAPTCAVNGHSAYYQCSICGKYFSDAAGEHEISLADTVIPATGNHSWGSWTSNNNGTHSHVCSVCGADEYVSCSYTEEEVPPTVTEQGYTLHTCTVCGYSYKDQYVAPLGEDFPVHFSVPAGVTAPADMISNTNTGITLPTVEGPEGYEFLGWVTEDYDNVETRPAVILSGNYIAPAEITLKALFTWIDGEGSGEKVYQQVEAPMSGGKYIIVADSSVSGTTGYAVGNTVISNNHYLTPVAVTVNSDGTCAASNVPAVLWAAESSGSGFTFYNEAVSKYMGLGSDEYLTLTDAGLAWAYTSDKYLDNQIDSEGYYYLSYSAASGSNPTRYTTGKTSTTANYVIRFYEETDLGTVIYTTIIGEEPLPEDLVDVYFVDQDGNAAAYVYAFGSNAQNAAFPGELLTAEGIDENGDNWYKITLDRSVYTNVIFSGGSNATQTADLGLGEGASIVYYVNGHTGYVGTDLWPEPPAVTEASCTEAGSVVYTGLLTGEEHVTELPALGHDWGEWTVTTAPSCTAEGEETRECSRCDAVETRPVAMIDHSYEANVIAPTCTEGGKTVYTCTVCGDSYEADLTDALGHNPGEPVQENYVEPTATEEGGFDSVIYCQRCGAELERTHTTLDPTGPAEPIEIDTIRIYPSISIGIEVLASFSVRSTDLSSYESWYIEVSKLDGEGNATESKRFGDGQEGSVSGSFAFKADYTDITAKEMGVPFTASVHAFDANGQEYVSHNIVSNSPVFTVRDYILGELVNEDNADATRKLAADLLNYGAAAQVYFDFDTENLVNENLSTEAQAAMDEFATTGEAPAVLVNNANSANIFSSVSVMNRIMLTLSIRGFSDAGAVQIEIKNHETGAVKEVIDAEKVNTIWRARYSAFEAEDMRTAFDFTVIADGSAAGTPITWSVEGYAREARQNEDATAEELALLNALLHYVDAAAAADFGS